jgi:hypothetical protein
MVTPGDPLAREEGGVHPAYIAGTSPPWARGRMVKYAAFRGAGLGIACALAVVAVALCAAELGVAIAVRGEARDVQPPFSGTARVGSVSGLYELGPVSTTATTGGSGSGSGSGVVGGDTLGEQLLTAIRAARGGEAFTDFPVQCARVYTECSIALVNSTSTSGGGGATTASNNPLGFACAELFDRDPIGFDAAACGTSVTPRCSYQLARCGPWLVQARALRDGAGPLYSAWLRETYGADVNSTEGSGSFHVKTPAELDGAYFGVEGYGYGTYLAGFPDAGRPAPPPNAGVFVAAVNGTGVADQVLVSAARKRFYLPVDAVATQHRRGRAGDPLLLRSRQITTLHTDFPRQRRLDADVILAAVQLVIVVVAAVPLFVAAVDSTRPRVAAIAIAWATLVVPSALLALYPHAHTGGYLRGVANGATDNVDAGATTESSLSSVANGPGHVVLTASVAEALFAAVAGAAALRSQAAVGAALAAIATVVPVFPAMHKAALAAKTLFPESVLAGAACAVAPVIALAGACVWVPVVAQTMAADALLASAGAVYILAWGVAAARRATRDVVSVSRSGPEVMAILGTSGMGWFSYLCLWVSRIALFAWVLLATSLHDGGGTDDPSRAGVDGAVDADTAPGADPFGTSLVLGVPSPVVWARVLAMGLLSYVLAVIVCSDALLRALMAVREGQRADRAGTTALYRAVDTALDAQLACEFAAEDARERIFGAGVVPVVRESEKVEIDSAVLALESTGGGGTKGKYVFFEKKKKKNCF